MLLCYAVAHACCLPLLPPFLIHVLPGAPETVLGTGLFYDRGVKHLLWEDFLPQNLTS